MSDKLYDVVIIKFDTKEVVSVAGKGMRMDGGTHNACRRLETVCEIIGPDYDAEIVPAGLLSVGDTLTAQAAQSAA